jgi:hypothetical protein
MVLLILKYAFLILSLALSVLTVAATWSADKRAPNRIERTLFALTILTGAVGLGVAALEDYRDLEKGRSTYKGTTCSAA